MRNWIAASALLAGATLAMAQPSPGEIGVYLDSGGTIASSCIDLAQPVDLYVIANTTGPIAAAEFALVVDARLVQAASTLPSSWIAVPIDDDYMLSGPDCTAGPGLTTLMHLQLFSFETALTIPPFNIEIQPASYSSFLPAAAGVAHCDATLLPTSLAALTIANSTVELHQSGQCLAFCEDQWVGADGAPFNAAGNWSGGSYPLLDRALLSNSSGSSNSSVVPGGANESLCAVTVKGPGALQILEVEAAAALAATGGIDVEDGGELLVDGTVNAHVHTTGSGTLSGGGSVDSFENDGNVDLNGTTLTVNANSSSTGLIDLTLASLSMTGLTLSSSGSIDTYTSASIAGHLQVQSPGVFTVQSGSASVTQCVQVDVGGTVNVNAGTSLFVLGCGGGTITGGGTINNSGFCPACKAEALVPADTIMDVDGGLGLDSSAELVVRDAVLKLRGDLDLSIDDGSRIDLRHGEIEFGDAAGVADVELISEYRGMGIYLEDPQIELLAVLRLSEAATSLRLVDGHDNAPGPTAETLYVESLEMAAGSTLDLAGQRLLYLNATPADPAAPGSGVNVIDTLGGGELLQLTALTATAPAPSRQLLLAYSISPNPFNPRTTLRWEQGATAPVRIDVYNERGALVRQLANESHGAGVHELVWDGRDGSGRNVASGVYLARLRVGSSVATKKLSLVR